MIYEVVLFLKSDDVLTHGYQTKLHGFIHEFFGENQYGEFGNNYVYSKIMDFKYNKDKKIVLLPESKIVIRSDSDNIWEALDKNLESDTFKNRPIFDNVYLSGYDINHYEECNQNVFKTSYVSPIIFSDSMNTTMGFHEMLSPEEISKCEKYLCNNVKERAVKCGKQIPDDFDIKILRQKNPTYIRYRKSVKIGRIFDLEIVGSYEVKEFILTHGIGCCVGIGNGFIY